MELITLTSDNNNLKRSIFLFDVVEEWNTNNIVSSLMEMNKQSEVEPINIFINSRGGLVTGMFAIIDAMNLIKAPINTFVIGQASSAAAVIASNGDKRYATEYARLMVHEVGGGTFGKTSEMEDYIEETKKLQEKMYNILSKNSNKAVSEIDTLLKKKDYFMSAEEAITFGLVDEILTEEQFASIKLSEKIESEEIALGEDLKSIHLLQVGEHKTSKYGTLSITMDMIVALKKNFDENVRNQEISIDYTHDNDNGEKKAGAWIKELYVENNGLYAKVEYTPVAKEMIENKEYKYVSAEFVLNYVKSDTGESVPYVLFGGTFTNRPVIKGLNTLKLSEEVSTMSLEEIKEVLKAKHQIDVEQLQRESEELKALQETNIKLSEENSSFETVKTQLENEKKEVTEAKEALEKELQDLKETTAKKEKENAVDTLVKEGKVLFAHKEKILNQFKSAQDMQEFYKDIPAVIKVESKGVNIVDKDEADEEVYDRLAEQTGMSKEDFKKYNKNKK